MLKLLYFAKLRDELGCAQEELPWQAELQCINDIKNYLSEREGPWSASFANPNILSAINQTLVNGNASISDGDEIAFFPPVTGG